MSQPAIVRFGWVLDSGCQGPGPVAEPQDSPGGDKYENEDLIKWGWPEDVWFHVDKHSSAHIYLRLKPDPGLCLPPMA